VPASAAPLSRSWRAAGVGGWPSRPCRGAAPQSGEEIVAALCSSSATFETKTEFAQEKYK
jgi:hypothetical protein